MSNLRGRYLNFVAFLENLNFNIENIVRSVPYSVLISIPKGQPKVMEMPGIRSKYPKFVDNKNSYVGGLHR